MFTTEHSLEFWREIIVGGFLLAVLALCTFALFGPAGGFHHHVGFSWIFPYMVWNGEDPDPQYFGIMGYEVWFDLWTFGINLVLWISIAATLIYTYSRTLASFAGNSNRTANIPRTTQ